jgi:ribonuclease HI
MALCKGLEQIQGGAYAIIESYSESVIEVMMGRAWKLEKNKGDSVKNATPVQQIASLEDQLNIESRKLKGHDGDEWNRLGDHWGWIGRN